MPIYKIIVAHTSIYELFGDKSSRDQNVCRNHGVEELSKNVLFAATGLSDLYFKLR